MTRPPLPQHYRWSCAAIAWISTMFAMGFYLFAFGFLLTRNVLPHHAAPTPNFPFLPTVSNLPATYPPATFKKALLVIIDALRYDFTLPVDAEHAAAAPMFHGKLPVLADLAAREPQRARLF